MSSGNERTYHFLEVAYSFDKMIEHVDDEASRAIDFDKIIGKHRQAMNNVEEKAMSNVEYDANDELPHG